MDKILVTGAGGFVAGYLRRVLIRDGFGVASVSRSDIRPIGGETTLTVSGYDDPAIVDVARGCRAAIHLVGGGRQTVHRQYHDTNHFPAAAVAEACRAADVPRMVYLSGLGVSPDATSGYFISKYLAERAVAGSIPEPVILRPSYIIGPDDHLTSSLRRQEQAGAVTIPGSGRYMMQPISVHDAVRVLAMAATRGAFAGRTLDMVGPQTTTFAEYIRAFAGPKTRIMHVDMEEIYRDAVLGRDPAYELDDLGIMVGGYVGDHGTLRRITGMRFRTIPQMLQSGGPA